MVPTCDDPVLFPESAGSPEGIVVINARYRVVSVSGLPLAHFAVGDRAGEAYAMVSLGELGWAKQHELA